HLVIVQIMEVHADKDVLDENGRPDAAKIAPLIFTVPDRNYRRMGEVVGKAFGAGKSLKKD
ncbi:MAG: flavin reductase family protein, partial [Nitrospirota bacterium]